MITNPKLSTLQINEEGLWVESPADNERIFLASIFDRSGRWLAGHTFYVDENRNKCFWNVDHTNWPAGIYLLVLRGERMLRQIKLIK